MAGVVMPEQLAVITDIDGILLVNNQLQENTYNYLAEMQDTLIFIVTARSESDRERTVERLRELEVPYEDIYFKPEDEEVVAYKVRIAELLQENYNVITALDDRSDVRIAYRELGIAALDLDEIPLTSEENYLKPKKMKKKKSFRAPVAGADKYTTEEEALDRAEEIGCEGTHSMDENGETIYMPCSTHAAYDEIMNSNEDEEIYRAAFKAEERQVNLTPPAYMRAAARRGLELNRQGKGGAGLTDKTKNEARLMAAGTVSADKWVRIAAWIARHLVDLDAPKNSNPQDPGYPGAGLVAHLLWGSGPSKSAANRTMKYAEGVVERLRAEEKKKRWSSVDIITKKDKEEKVSLVERRIKNNIDFEIRVDDAQSDGMKFSGYAAVFNSNSEPLPFTERILEGAFSKTLRSRNEVKLFKNHNMDEVLASTRSKTLKLREDSTGLLAEATLPDTTAGRDLAVLMQRGDVHSMSFGFTVPDGGDSWNSKGSVRELREVRLHEVSIVTGFPAYENTTASVRSLEILAKRSQVDEDKIADVLLKLESGETLPADEANLLVEIVDKLREEKEELQVDLSNLDLKRKELDLLFKAV
jgi:HK97 family phage prohead protease